MPAVPANVLAEIVRVAPSLHKAGTFSAHTLAALARHAAASPIHRSVETGSGASTLLFSHLSEDHTVFAIDSGTGSIRSIEGLPLLRRDKVTFVEGPTQLTLPRHTFTQPLQLALIDGPHGYPFPDLEYYYLYPHLETGALLIVDDIQIPTITNLFDVLSADEMFTLEEVVETTAFFRRTEAATFSPIGDGWWLQGYNKRVFESKVAELRRGAIPERVDRPTSFYLDRFGPVGDPLRAESIVVPRLEPLIISGWAIDDLGRKPAAAVDLAIDGVIYRAAVGVPRVDVATAHADREYTRCGFEARLPAETLTDGVHDLEFRIVTNGERDYWLAARLRFTVG